MVLAPETLDERREVGIEGYAEVEKAEPAYAGVGPDLPGAFTLRGPSELVGFVIWTGKRGLTMEYMWLSTWSAGIWL